MSRTALLALAMLLFLAVVQSEYTNEILDGSTGNKKRPDGSNGNKKGPGGSKGNKIRHSGGRDIEDSDFNCNETEPSNETNPNLIPQALCYIETCQTAIQDHIKNEFDAAFTYLAMGAHFAQQDKYRPGIAKFFLGAASEERSHAIQMLDYLNKRGISLNDKNKKYAYDNNPLEENQQLLGIGYKDALIEALNMELKVTRLIYKVIKNCEDDYHGADVFTNPILDEQHEGVRHLQGAIKVFDNLAEGAKGEFKNYAEYIFDMKLLKGEVAAH